MTDRELLEQILTKVTKIDSLEGSLNQIHTKLDGVTAQVVQLSESITTIKEQTAANTELRAPLTDAIARIDAIETDLKLMKKVITS